MSLVCGYLLFPGKSTYSVSTAEHVVAKSKRTELLQFLGIFSYQNFNAEHVIQAQFGTEFQYLVRTRSREPIHIFIMSRFNSNKPFYIGYATSAAQHDGCRPVSQEPQRTSQDSVPSSLTYKSWRSLRCAFRYSNYSKANLRSNTFLQFVKQQNNSLSSGYYLRG